MTAPIPTFRTARAFIPASEALPAIIDALPDDDAYVSQFRFTRERQHRFLTSLSECGEVRAAARRADVAHQTAYRLRRSNRAFRLAWDAALLIAREQVEAALASRAINGVEEEVFYHGEVVATRRRYDSRLLLAHLARLDRLEQRDDVAAMAADFDLMVAAYARGELDEDEGAEDTGADSPSGPCNRRSMSGAQQAGAQVLALEERLTAMEAARPPDAPSLAEQAAALDSDVDALEAAQLAAYEAGEDTWWLVANQFQLD